MSSKLCLETENQRIAKGAGGKGPRQKKSKSVKKCFDTFRQFSHRAKNLKNRQKVSKVSRHFSTSFARHHVSGPCWGALRETLDTFKILRHVMRAILSVRPTCSHRCVSLKETPLKPVQILKRTTKTQPSKPL